MLHHHAVSLLMLHLIFETLILHLSLRLVQVLRNLKTGKSSKCHATEAGGCWWVLIVEESSQFARCPEPRDRDVVGGENTSVQVGLDSTVAIADFVSKWNRR